MASPYHPHDGACFIMEVRKNANTIEDVRKFVDQDPYVQKGIVDSFKIDGVFITHLDEEFERITQKFMVRTWESETCWLWINNYFNIN